MGDRDNKSQQINDSINNANKAINDTMGMFGTLIDSIVPKGAQKEITIEVVEKKGFFGIGRKTKKIKATAYISMNNILNLDIHDKNEMKDYFDQLK